MLLLKCTVQELIGVEHKCDPVIVIKITILIVILIYNENEILIVNKL